MTLLPAALVGQLASWMWLLAFGALLDSLEVQVSDAELDRDLLSGRDPE